MFSRREAAKFLRVLPQKVTKIYCAQLYKDLCTFSIFMHQPKNFCAPLCTGRKKIVHWRKKLCTVHKKACVKVLIVKSKFSNFEVTNDFWQLTSVCESYRHNYRASNSSSYLMKIIKSRKAAYFLFHQLRCV